MSGLRSRPRSAIDRLARAAWWCLTAAPLLLATRIARADPTTSEQIGTAMVDAKRTAILLALLLVGVMGLTFPASHFVAAWALGVRGLGFFGLKPAAEYFEANLGKRLLVRAAGPLGVWLLIATLAAWGIRLTGTPRASLVLLVFPGHAADLAGMQHGDRVVTVAGVRVESFEEFRSQTLQHGAGPVDIGIERTHASMVFCPVADARGKIGVMGTPRQAPVSLSDSMAYGLSHPGRILGALKQGFRGKYATELDGPISRVVHPMSTTEIAGLGDYFLVVATAGAVCLPSLVICDLLIAYLVWRNRKRRREGAPGEVLLTQIKAGHQWTNEAPEHANEASNRVDEGRCHADEASDLADEAPNRANDAFDLAGETPNRANETR